MDWLVLSALTLASVSSAVYAVLLSRDNARLRDELAKTATDRAFLLQENTDLLESKKADSGTLVVKTTAILILTMKLMAANGEYEKVSMYRNRLYFWGVSREVLDDGDLLNGFLEMCVEGNVAVEPGDQPYAFKFRIGSGAGNEGRHDNKKKETTETRS